MRLSDIRSSYHSLGLSLCLPFAVALAGCSSSDGTTAPAAAGSSSGGKAGAGDAGANTSGNSNGGAAQAGGAAGGAAGSADSGGSSVGGGIAHGGSAGVDYGNMTPPPAEWTNITNNLAGLTSECGNMGGVFPSPYIDMLVAGVARQGLYSSTDGGGTYAKIGTTGDMILNRLIMIHWDPDAKDTFYMAGIYGFETPFTDSVFKTTNNGASFTGYAALAMLQSSNDSVSLDFSDPDRKTMLAGGHEQTQALFLSTDSGSTWKDIGKSLPATVGFCTQTLVLDSKTLLVGCAAGYSGKGGAVLRSTDTGATWSQVSATSVVGEPLWASDGSIYWAIENGGIAKSVDQGKTFTSVADAGTAGAVKPIELPGGRIVSFAQHTLKGSTDAGKTWQVIGTALPFDPTGIGYSPFRRAFYAWHFDCTSSVPADAIARFGFDFAH